MMIPSPVVVYKFSFYHQINFITITIVAPHHPHQLANGSPDFSCRSFDQKGGELGEAKGNNLYKLVVMMKLMTKLALKVKMAMTVKNLE